MREYSANPEEKMIRDFFTGYHTGFFVEVGAFHPFDLSVSWPFEQVGWQGILVEPIPEFADRCRKNRSAIVFECACAAPTSPNEVEISVDGAFSSMTEGRKGRHEQISDKRITVACRTLDSILQTIGIKKITLLAIDVEGAEFEVLQGVSLREYLPELIFIEDHMHTLHSHRHLIANGYKLIRRTGVNNWYVPNSTNHSVSISERVRLLKKVTLTPVKHRLKKWLNLSA